MQVAEGLRCASMFVGLNKQKAWTPRDAQIDIWLFEVEDSKTNSNICLAFDSPQFSEMRLNLVCSSLLNAFSRTSAGRMISLRHESASFSTAKLTS